MAVQRARHYSRTARDIDTWYEMGLRQTWLDADAPTVVLIIDGGLLRIARWQDLPMLARVVLHDEAVKAPGFDVCLRKSDADLCFASPQARSGGRAAYQVLAASIPFHLSLECLRSERGLVVRIEF